MSPADDLSKHHTNLVVSVMSAVCTPVGLSRMFTVMGQLLVKPAVSDLGSLSFFFLGQSDF